MELSSSSVHFLAWIDINLMVTPVTIPLLLRGLHLASPTYTAIRIATADALIDTVTKGMPSNDKLALLSVLDLATVLHQLVNVGRTSPGLADNETEMFREKLAKVLNGMGTELCKIIEDVGDFDLRSTCRLLTLCDDRMLRPSQPNHQHCL